MRAVHAGRAKSSTEFDSTFEKATPSSAEVLSSPNNLAISEVAEFVSSKLFTLVNWPEMRLVPADQLGALARICALLARAPSAGFLVHSRLGLEREEAISLLFSMYTKGHLRVFDSGSMTPESIEALSEQPPTSSQHSVWSRLLNRLLG